MRAMSVSLKEAAAVVAAILLNAFILSQLVGGLNANQPSPAFAQPYDDGLPCVDPGDCISGNCVDDVCCNVACENPGQACDIPGSIGICNSVIPAPSMNLPGQFMAATLLTLLGWFGLRRLRRQD
jgi:hypothetical protein